MTNSKTKIEQLFEHFLNEASKKLTGTATPTDKAEFIQQGIDRDKILKMPNEPIDPSTLDRLSLDFGEKLAKMVEA